MGSTRTWRALTLVLLVVLVGAVARSTFAMPVVKEGKSIKSVGVVTETAVNSISTGRAYSPDLPGASISVQIPEGTESLILVRFSAESACYGKKAGWCNVVILVGGDEASPKAGESFAFDSVNTDGAEDYEAHAMERVSGPKQGDGVYTVQVQRRIHVTGTGIAGQSVFRLDDWTLTVERIDVP
jgi:hypothetical protein